MKTKLYYLSNGKKHFALDLGEEAFDFYLNQCKAKGVQHTLKGRNELNINNVILLKRVKA